MIRISRCFLEYFYFRACTEVKALNYCWSECWREWFPLEEEQWRWFTTGVLNALTRTNLPAETWSPTYQPALSERWCNCTSICRRRSNKVRTELRLALNLNPNHGACWSLSRQQEYTGHQSASRPLDYPQNLLRWSCRVQTEKHHLSLNPPKEVKISPWLHWCRISHSYSAVTVSIGERSYDKFTNKSILLRFSAKKVPIQQIHCCF